jgi:hypothetical protein
MMLEIIHELYAVQIHNSIPDKLVQEFKRDIGYDQLIESNNFDPWHQPNWQMLSALHLFKYINGILSPYGIGIENLDYFIWPLSNKGNFTIHVDGIHNLNTNKLEAVSARVNIPIQGTESIMEWYDTADVVPTVVRDDSSSYYEFNKRDDKVKPIHSIPASTPLIVNASIPHTINLNNSITDRFTISGRIRKNLPFAKIIQRIRDHV